MPWFFYDWIPDTQDTNVLPEALDERTLAQAYLDKKGRYLEPLARRYIEQCCKAPFSFYDILFVRPGNGFLLRDIISGEEVDVTEHSGSTQAEAGDILFGKVAQLDDLAVLEASAPLIFPSKEKKPILDLREDIHNNKLPITPELLKDYDIEMLDIYHDITARLFSTVMPEPVNADGEPLVPQVLIYEIKSPQVAFKALKHLNIYVSEDELMAEAKFNTKGELRAIEFSWQKEGNMLHNSWENTILAHIRINGRKMKAEVNSDNRAKKFRALIDELLLAKARYKTTVLESLPFMSEPLMESGNGKVLADQREMDELQNDPEVQAHINKMMHQYYRQWPEEKLPALDGKTPLQAVKTKNGREMVEALLLDFEQTGKHSTPPLDPAIITELRERLGLQKR